MWFRSFAIFWVHKYSIHFYNWIQFHCIDVIMLLCTFLGISFDWYKEWTICLISFYKLSEWLPTFNCARAISNFWSICLGDNIVSPVPVVDFNGNNPLLKALITNSLKTSFTIKNVTFSFLFFFWLRFSLVIKIKKIIQ